MLIDAIRNITSISNIDSINSDNYMESLTYIDRVYDFINILKRAIPLNAIEFDASFKGFHTCEKYNIESSPEENEMRVFVIKSVLEDTIDQDLMMKVFKDKFIVDFQDMTTVRFINKEI